MKKINFKDRKTRIILLSAPMFLLPLALLAFSIMSGMESNEPLPEPQLNSSIPKADEKGNPINLSKWKTYESQSAAKDWVEAVAFFTPEDTVPELPRTGVEVESILFPLGSEAHHEKLIEQQLLKLEKLQQQLEKPDQEAAVGIITGSSLNVPTRREAPEEIQKLEQLMHKMEEKRGLPDPELLQLENLLDKIMMLQFPEKYVDDAVTASKSEELFDVKPQPSEDINRNHFGQENGFFGLSEGPEMEVNVSPSIPAVIDENKKIVSGNSLRLSLTDGVAINGMDFPAQTKLYGTCRLEGERLLISIAHIRSGKHLLPVRLEAFGMDAIQGIHIPGALGREAAKEGIDRGVMGVNPMMGGLTLETQLAASGIDTARGFLGKKAKLKKVNVKQGHPLLLVDRS